MIPKSGDKLKITVTFDCTVDWVGENVTEEMFENLVISMAGDCSAWCLDPNADDEENDAVIIGDGNTFSWEIVGPHSLTEEQLAFNQLE